MDLTTAAKENYELSFTADGITLEEKSSQTSDVSNTLFEGKIKDATDTTHTKVTYAVTIDSLSDLR